MMNWRDYGIELSTVRNSGNVKAHCPRCHADRRDKRDKSLSCNMATGMFKCHHCGWTGCAKEPSESEKREWMERQPWFNPHPIRREKREYRKPEPKKDPRPMSAQALEWFADRGISRETVEALRVTEGMEWMPQKEGEANTVQFNYYREGELLNTKFRTGDKYFKLVQGAELLPYNIDAIKGTAECIVTEGEMDALSFVEAGRKDVVSVPNGANANLGYLDDCIEQYFDDKQTIYIAVDTDTQGIKLRHELVRRFGAERCRIVEYGEGCKDANEHLVRYGAASLLECLGSAREVKIEGVFGVSDFEASLDAIFEHGLQPGVTLGHPNLDRLISFETQRLCVVTGIPSSGKSEFVDEIVERLNIRHGWRTAFFSPENAPLAYHASKLIEKLTGCKFSKATLPFDEYTEAKRHLDENFFFINPEKDFCLSTILDKAKTLVRRKGVKCVVIDPYNRLDNENRGLTGTEYIGLQLKQMINFAKLNDVLLILVAHPTKLQKSSSGNYDKPTLYDISGSANFFNMTDFGICVHRNLGNETVEVEVQKVKFRHLGETGVATFKYNKENGRYQPCKDTAKGVAGQAPEMPKIGEWDNASHLPSRRGTGMSMSMAEIWRQHCQSQGRQETGDMRQEI